LFRFFLIFFWFFWYSSAEWSRGSVSWRGTIYDFESAAILSISAKNAFRLWARLRDGKGDFERFLWRSGKGRRRERTESERKEIFRIAKIFGKISATIVALWRSVLFPIEIGVGGERAWKSIPITILVSGKIANTRSTINQSFFKICFSQKRFVVLKTKICPIVRK